MTPPYTVLYIILYRLALGEEEMVVSTVVHRGFLRRRRRWWWLCHMIVRCQSRGTRDVSVRLVLFLSDQTTAIQTIGAEGKLRCVWAIEVNNYYTSKVTLLTAIRVWLVAGQIPSIVCIYLFILRSSVNLKCNAKDCARARSDKNEDIFEMVRRWWRSETAAGGWGVLSEERRQL